MAAPRKPHRKPNGAPAFEVWRRERIAEVTMGFGGDKSPGMAAFEAIDERLASGETGHYGFTFPDGGPTVSVEISHEGS